MIQNLAFIALAILSFTVPGFAKGILNLNCAGYEWEQDLPEGGRIGGPRVLVTENINGKDFIEVRYTVNPEIVGIDFDRGQDNYTYRYQVLGAHEVNGHKVILGQMISQDIISNASEMEKVYFLMTPRRDENGKEVPGRTSFVYNTRYDIADLKEKKGIFRSVFECSNFDSIFNSVSPLKTTDKGLSLSELSRLLERMDKEAQDKPYKY